MRRHSIEIEVAEMNDSNIFGILTTHIGNLVDFTVRNVGFFVGILCSNDKDNKDPNGICIYRKYCIFETPSQIPIQANDKISRIPKPPSLIFLILGGKERKYARHHKTNKSNEEPVTAFFT